MTHLWDRLNEAAERLKPVQSQYRIVYADPAQPSAPASIVAPAPEWMAAAMAGGVLPPIEQYHLMRLAVIFKTPQGEQQGIEVFGLGLPDLLRDLAQAGCKIEGQTVIESNFSNYEPIGPMSEEQAIEYLVKKDVPHRVWADHDRINFRRFKIVRQEAIPTDRTHRNAWELAA